jgi:transposase-like protein
LVLQILNGLRSGFPYSEFVCWDEDIDFSGEKSWRFKEKATKSLEVRNYCRDASMYEVTPKVWTKNFWGFIMRKKHEREALLKYMVMLKEGRSFRSISDEFGINAERLKCLWILYQTEGESVLRRKRPIKVSEKLKLQIVSDVNKNNLTLVSASLKYGVSARRLSFWLKVAREQGLDVSSTTKERSMKSIMGRPRKKKPEEMTELERLREENEYLRMENALLKKVKALVEEREARWREIGQKPSKN